MSDADTASNPALGLALLVANLWRGKATEAPMEDGSKAQPAGSGGEKETKNPFTCYYASLVHQQNMLQDTVRTAAYHSAITGNPADFRGKVVVDVGTGSGILAIFAARAGARKVYAIEASDSADRARKLVAANGLSHVITVVKGRVEELTLPEQADVIVSEPMGFALIHERMLESYIAARLRFMRPGGGLMFPSTGSIFVAPFTDAQLHSEQLAKVGFWSSGTDFFGTDLSCLAEEARADHFAQPVVGYVDTASLLAVPPGPAHVIDFASDAPDSLHTIDIPLDFTASRTGVCHGIAAWFDVLFPGSQAPVTLTTSPFAPGTHWYQCRVLLREPIAVNAGQRLVGVLHCAGNERFSYNMQLTLALAGSEATTADGRRIESVTECSLADQQYSYLTGTASGGHSS